VIVITSFCSALPAVPVPLAMVRAVGVRVLLYVTMLSVLVEAAFAFPAASCATPAPTVAMMVPLVVMPETATL
jgi:hypothetical protein